MANREPFEFGEWYHCFNRGVDKRNVFENEHDANRFLMLLYLANGVESVGLYNIQKPMLKKVLQSHRGNQLVSIGAYCLMPNHFHLLLKEVTDGGISIFMRKLGIAYAMYFNAKNDRVGNLFIRPFRSRHVGTDRYFQRVLEYIHCNPAELYESGWKSGKVRNLNLLEKKLVEYPYSSFGSYVNMKDRSPILSRDGFEIANHGSARCVLEDARTYYAELERDRFER